MNKTKNIGVNLSQIAIVKIMYLISMENTNRLDLTRVKAALGRQRDYIFTFF